jgi:sugar (pentulose or hexulose) kinase
MARKEVIAIFDIGKTNKKFLLFDADYNIIFETSSHLAETIDEDGDPCEDVHALIEWIRQTFNDAHRSAEYTIRAVNYSTYGASFVNIDDNGQPATALSNYLKPFPEELLDQFYSKYGGRRSFARTTASPVLGNLNSGMQLYRLRSVNPVLFATVRRSLHLPQFVSFLFTNQQFSDLTSIGCHTNLWDFSRQDYHPWVSQEEILTRLAPVCSSSKVFQIKFKNEFLYSGIGLHDSSSALIPYLSAFTEPFVLVSTGTWCIALNPFNASPLTDAELDQDCLCYLSYRGKPVKASRLFAGHLHDQEVKRIAAHYNVDEDFYQQLAQRTETLSDRSGRTAGTIANGNYKEGNYTRYSSCAEAYDGLMAEIADRQARAISLVMSAGIKKVFVDGGFTRNRLYLSMIANRFPELEVYAANVVQASALGAALAIHSSWNKKPVREDLLVLESINTAS